VKLEELSVDIMPEDRKCSYCSTCYSALPRVPTPFPGLISLMIRTKEIVNGTVSLNSLSTTRATQDNILTFYCRVLLSH
jgi:hypothetical protein